MEFIKPKKFLIIFIIFLSFVFLSLNVSAHSPSSMTLSYDSSANELQVDISHQVSNPNTHYVENIVVKINGETNISRDYTSQSGSSFSYTYEGMVLSEGDLIQVTATCNQGGSISKELTISSEGVSETGDDSSTPGFELLVFIISIAAIVIFIKKR
jgi:hypothetical protein